jgi:hypothetical protein
MTEAVEHYKINELADCGRDGKAYSTRNRKTLVLNRWVLPHWGKLDLRAIKTVAVEQWLKTLVTSKVGKPKPLAGGTREKIRDAMSSVFNHAIRWEFTDRNPITGPVRAQVFGSQQSVNGHLTFSKLKRCICCWEHWGFGKGRWCFSTCRRDYAGANWLG